MDITWTINNLERQSSDGLVTVAHWSVTATDGDYSANRYGSVGLARGDNFTAFEDLTEQQVLEWVKTAVNSETVEADLAAQIEEQKNPVSLAGVPWSKATEA